jgi:hypothetical protein
MVRNIAEQQRSHSKKFNQTLNHIEINVRPSRNIAKFEEDIMVIGPYIILLVE